MLRPYNGLLEGYCIIHRSTHLKNACIAGHFSIDFRQFSVFYDVVFSRAIQLKLC